MSENKNHPITIIDPLTITNYTPFIDPIPPLTIENAMEGELITACFSKAFLPYIAALIEPLVWADRFEGTEAERNHSAALFEELRFILVKDGNCMFDPCCPDDGEKLAALIALFEINNTNQVTIINQNYETILTQEFNRFEQWVTSNTEMSIYNSMIYDGTPQSIAPSLGDNWNDVGESDTDGRLCNAVKRWIDYVVYAETLTLTQEAQAIGAVTAAVAAGLIAAAAPTAGVGAVAGIIVAAAGAISGFVFNNWLTAFNDPEARRKVYCCMYDSLKDTAVSPESFAASVDDCGFDGGTSESNIAGRLHAFNQFEENYQAFLRMLGEVGDGDPDDCECGCDPDDFEIIAIDGVSTVTKIDATHWLVQNTTHTPYDAGKRQFVSRIKEASDRCINVYAHPAGTAGYNVLDCEGDTHTGIGGGNGTLREYGFVKLEYNEDPVVGVNDVLMIICP